jgi:homoserine dehydrogenase
VTNVRIVLVGFGVVGQSFARILVQRRAGLANEHGLNPSVVAIVDRGGAAINPKGLDLEKMLVVKSEKRTIAASREHGHPSMSALNVIESVEAETMVEATPTNVIDGEPGLSYMKTAFRTGKHVVTTNKGPLALALPALTELADYNKVHLRFSGTVGAGTPVLDLAKRCLLGDKIVSVRGVLNGTTNYILTEMDEKHITFKQALEDAQKLGYAEADPSKDVDGIDTACKSVIIANWIMNKKVTLKDVSIQGIRNVTPQDLEKAAKKGHVVKLIGSIGTALKVAPTEIDRHDPLSVRAVLNAVTFVSEFAGEETIIGRGAGGMETASAVLRDLLWIKGNLTAEMVA